MGGPGGAQSGWALFFSQAPPALIQIKAQAPAATRHRACEHTKERRGTPPHPRALRLSPAPAAQPRDALPAAGCAAPGGSPPSTTSCAAQPGGRTGGRPRTSMHQRSADSHCGGGTYAAARTSSTTGSAAGAWPSSASRWLAGFSSSSLGMGWLASRLASSCGETKGGGILPRASHPALPGPL